MIKVLIIDDDKLARKGLMSIVPWSECDMEVVGEAANGQKALEFLYENEVDLAVVDLSMPVMTGLDFIRKARKRFPLLQYVVLSFHEDFLNVQAALRLGTLDYISKMRLEQQDCTDVFQHVSALIKQNVKSPEPESFQMLPAESEKDADWEKTQADWLQFYWLYTQNALERLSESTFQLNPSPRKVEHLLVRICEQAKNMFHYEELIPVPGIPDVQSGLQWISEFKSCLAGLIRNTPDLNSTEACIFRAAEYAKSHLSEHLSIDIAAKQVNMSRSYFAVNFKKATGLTFNVFLRQERVKKAMHLLMEQEVTPYDVAQAVGYEDEKYFAQIFTELTGTTPVEFTLNQTL